jgi:hypothetical protein
MKILNVRSNYDHSKEAINSLKGKVRVQLSIENVAGKTWLQKKNLVMNKLLKVFGDIPTGVSFAKRETRDLENNPDGLRIFVICDWIKRNRFHDNKGIFHMGSLIQAINRQIEGKTKKRLLRKIEKTL